MAVGYFTAEKRMTMFSKKAKKIFSAVIAILLIAAMVLGGAVSMLF